MKVSYIAILALILLSACAQTTQNSTTPTQTYECPDGTIVENLDDCQTQEEFEDEEYLDEEYYENEFDYETDNEIDYRPGEGVFTTDEQATSSVAAELSQMQERAQDKTSNGYSYTYSESQNQRPVNTEFQASRFSVREDNVLIKFPDTTQYQGAEVTHIVTTLNADTGTAYCVGCRESVEQEVSIPVFITPMQYLMNVENSEFVGMQSIDRRSSYRIQASFTEQPITLYADSFSGLPLRIETENGRTDFSSIGLSVSEDAFELN